MVFRPKIPKSVLRQYHGSEDAISDLIQNGYTEAIKERIIIRSAHLILNQ